jgi:glutamate-1-semialdehyde 2,1-aminomutase
MSKSIALQEHARERIPGMTQLLSKRPDMFSANIWPGYYSRAKGAKIWDLDGRQYLDMSIGGIGACVLGYADDEVDEAVIRTVRDGVACSLNCPEEVRLADKLCELHPWADMARFARSGAEALAVAVRIARAHTGRDVVACCGYHGWSDWYLAANLAEDSALDGHLIPGLEPAGVPRGLQGTLYTFRYNHLEELQILAAAHRSELAAIVMEPVRSKMPEAGFIEGVRAVADKAGAVLIMDEVSAGFRYCTGGAHLVLHKVQPDMAIFSKALGNGYAVSAVIGREEVMQAAQQTFISSTNWTERVGPTAALACIKAYAARKPYEKFSRFGQRIKTAWKDMGERNGFTMHVEGMDAMAHFSINDSDFLSLKAYFVQCMLEEDILASNLCYLMDAHTEADIDRYITACERTFTKMAEAREKGGPALHLKGAPAVAGFRRLA